MREKCDMCGNIRNIEYTFQYLDYVFGYKLKFCKDCGEKIMKFLERGKR